MIPDLQTAIQALRSGGCTCVLCRDGQIDTDTRRGVAPLLSRLEAGKTAPGFCAADKVVGKATAFLYCLLGARAVHAFVISEAALAVLNRYGIPVTYDDRVEFIRNRAGDGLCPMEAATMSVHDPEAALEAVRRTLKSLTTKN